MEPGAQLGEKVQALLVAAGVAGLAIFGGLWQRAEAARAGEVLATAASSAWCEEAFFFSSVLSFFFAAAATRAGS